MKTFIYPRREEWDQLCKRPLADSSDLTGTVNAILQNVRNNGDFAVRDLEEKYDGAVLKNLKISQAEVIRAVKNIPEDLKNAINVSKANIEKFHSSQLADEKPVETMKGVMCWRKNVPIEKVGLYIPGGTSPLFSTVLMLAIPAKIADCREIVLCSPPNSKGNIDPTILYTAWLTGVTDIFKIGGAQAIAAMAYGTETVPKVNKIFGPGNQYVTLAKQMVLADGIAIDMPAGPSEVLIMADGKANASYVASDLLAQAEHGPDSQVILVTDDVEVIKNVQLECENQLNSLPRREIAANSLENSLLILMNSIDECMDFSNRYAPEHLIINVSDPKQLADRVINAGSVFIGNYSCESAGDYASGTNHTLPTNGFARSYSGVSVDSFVKKITFQEISTEGLKNLGPVIEQMAAAESLSGHRNAVSIRLKSLGNG
ncbi:MAG: histidinol dehydrogenase [Bacteroidota bacterium]|nr:histidinol dehydrogenase [Bacteroidota bacterium]